MTLHRLTLRAHRLVRHSRLLQVAVLIAFWLAGNAVSAAAHLPVPGAIIGMLAALALLLSRRLSLSTVRRGADWLIAEMLLFFVPAVLAILNHHELFGLLGLKILAVIVVGTSSVMAVTAFTVDACARASVHQGLRHAGPRSILE